MLYLYTDGGCWPNPGGVGGWAWVLVRSEKALARSSGWEWDTTNNRMELTAALRGLRAVPTETELVVVSDSQYVVHGATRWRPSWERKKFKGVKNLDLWRQIFEQADLRRADWKWVKGHNGHYWNEMCDRLASEAVRSRRQEKNQAEFQQLKLAWEKHLEL